MEPAFQSAGRAMSEPLREDIKARLAKYRRADRSWLPAPLPTPKPRWGTAQTKRDWSNEKVIRVADIVAGVFGVPIYAMPSPRRTRGWARPRQAAMSLCCLLLPEHSLPQIGQTFGFRHHTTVLHAREKCKEWMVSPDPKMADFQAKYRESLEQCREALGV